MTLLEQLNQKELRMNEIANAITALDVTKPEASTKLDALETEYGKLGEERAAILKSLEIIPVNVTVPQFDITQVAQTDVRSNDPRGTNEYRKAFMEYVQTSKRSNALFGEGRADASTVQTDVSAVIPSTILNQIIDILTTSGNIFSRITKTSYATGTRIPINSINPTATWVGENSKSDRQKMQVNTYVEFSSYKLQARVAVSLETSVNALEMFEKLIATKIATAIINAIETSVISGSGTGQPTGITIDSRVTAGQKVSTKIADLNYAGHVTRYGKIPAAYLNSKLVYLMHQETYFKYMLSLLDDNKQPVARVTQGLDGKPSYYFLGAEVVFNNTMPTADAATANQIFIILGDLTQFDFNSNMSLTYRKYVDEETDEIVDKATLLGDGKLLDPSPFVLYKKDTAA